jgi:hypothetical protein
MYREASQIPFLLWLPAAVMLHMAGGGGAIQAAKSIQDLTDILSFARGVREDVRLSLNGEMTTVALLDDSLPAEEKDPDDDDAASDETDDDETDDAVEPERPKPFIPKPKTPEQKKAAALARKKLAEKKKLVPPPLKPLKSQKKEEEEEKKPPMLAKKAPEAPKKDEDKKPEKKKDDKQKLELPPPDGRIAVINDPDLDKNQKDNPNARRIADHANTVKEEAMARFRSYDQNASKPTGGGNPEESDPTAEQPGNHSEDKRGHSVENDDPGPTRPGSENGPSEIPDPVKRSQQGSNAPISGQKGTAAQKGVHGREAGKGEVMHETVNAAGGGWKISPDGGDGRKAAKGRAGRAARRGLRRIPGVPIPGQMAGKYSISAYGLQAALGKAHLRKEQEKARNTRLTRHRGRLTANTFQKYRAAIENYDPSVKPGNQTSLNAARVPFAAYINRMHNRIHPIFADSFLGGLNRLPTGDKLADMKLFSHMEIVLDGETGAVVRAGIVKPSGVTAFDVGALSSIHAAAPFGMSPDVIVSPDGKVYLHWEFYRNPYYACTSKFAHPYLIKDNGQKSPGGTPPRRPPSRGSEGKRFGKNAPLAPRRSQ